MQLLRDIARSGERAVVTVSHDQRIREVADRVLWLEDGRLTDIGRLVQDPVCGMSVEAARSVMFAHAGQAYHFCSRGCLWEFEQAPQEFVTPR